jgi:hypothetical protein
MGRAVSVTPLIVKLSVKLFISNLSSEKQMFDDGWGHTHEAEGAGIAAACVKGALCPGPSSLSEVGPGHGWGHNAEGPRLSLRSWGGIGE